MTAYITGVGGVPGAGWFTDNTGAPRLWVASETWGLVLRAGEWNGGSYQNDYDNFFAARAAQGVTVTIVDPIGPGTADSSTGAPANGVTWDGVSPFTSTSPITLRSTFWTRIDYMVSSAASNGITIGFDFNLNYTATTGGAMNGWTNTQFQDYGAAIGGRYASSPNVIWLFGNDEFQGTHDTQFDSILTGLTGAGASQLVIAWWSPEYTSRRETDNNAAATWGRTNSAANFCYSYNCNYWVTEYAYTETASPDNEAHLLPAFIGDGYFYQGSSTYFASFDRGARQEAWWALASGARGFLAESENVFPWGSSAALSAVSSNWYWANNLANIVTRYTSLTGWHKLIPDTGNALVTAGRGTRASGFTSGGSGGQYEPAFTNSYVAASITPAGDLAVLYLPNHTTITVNQSLLVAGYTASWVDPVTGAMTSTATGTTYNSTAQGNSSQGDPDWVLVLQGPVAAPATTIGGPATVRRYAGGGGGGWRHG